MGSSIGIGDVGNPGVRGGARAPGATSVDSRTRHGIVLVATPETEVEGGVVFLVSAGKLDSGSGFAVAAADNLDLSAAGVWLERSDEDELGLELTCSRTRLVRHGLREDL